MHGVYVITPELEGQALINAAQAALKGKPCLLQYRNKQASLRQKQQDACNLKALCDDYQVPLIINDSLMLAQQVQAGVHLGRDDDHVLDQIDSTMIVGLSVYNELSRVQQATADISYIALGSFFPSVTKPNAARVQPELITQARQWFSGAICAIGGITLNNVDQLIPQVDMVAVISDIFSARDITAQVQRYNEHFGLA